MPHKILFICHRADSSFTYGGHAFRRAIQAMLQQTRPDLVVDEIFFENQSPWRSTPLAKGLTFLRSIFSHLPAKACHFKSTRFANRLRAKLASSSYSAAVITGIDMLWCLDLLPASCRRIYLANNVEHLLYADQIAALRRIPLFGHLFALDLGKLKNYEMTGVAKADRVIAISSADEEYFHAQQPGLAIATILPSFSYPPARDANPAKQRHDGPIRLSFLGNLEWWPNRRSITWFLTEIWPCVTVKNLEAHLYGKGSELLDNPVARVHGHGYARDLDTVWANSDIMIQPITSGGGVNIKVAEAIYNRMPMLATPVALRGLPIREDPAIAVLRDREEWIEFLNSGRPGDLRAQSVCPENSHLFNLASNAEKLARFVSPCLPPLHTQKSMECSGDENACA